MLGGNGVTFQVKFFGWCHDPEHNHDKIWGWVTVGDDEKLYNFWGRRADLDAEKGKKLSFKRHDKRWGTGDLEALMRKKMRPTGGKPPYKSIPCTRDHDGNYTDIEAVYKDFAKHFKGQLMLARLTGTVKGEEV